MVANFGDFSDPETRFDGADRNVVGGVDVGDGDLVKESGVLYGETQALDDSEGPGGDGDFDVGDWGKTQLIEESEEDAAADDDDDENDEGTAVLSADEGLSDDGATPGGNERKAEDAELGLAETAKDENLSSGDGKDKENLVDSDASTDDEEVCEGNALFSACLLIAENMSLHLAHTCACVERMYIEKCNTSSRR